ncbi:MAG: alpha/beta fold hydrolase [Acidimicrobiales bacterium]
MSETNDSGIRRPAAPSFVFIHGAGHGAWCWEPVMALLRHRAIAVDLPGRGLKPAELGRTISALASSVVEDMDAAGLERVILVGHSGAGVVVPAVAALVPNRVDRVIFVSCAIPPEGGRLRDTISPVLWWVTNLANLGKSTLDPPPKPVARWLFCNGMDSSQRDVVLQHLCPEVKVIASERVSRRELPSTIPLTYVKLLKDRAIAPRRQDRMIANLGHPEVVTMDAGHDVMISHPADLAALLERVADSGVAPPLQPSAGNS